MAMKGEAAVFAEGSGGVAKVAGETIEVGFHTSKLYTEPLRIVGTSRQRRRRVGQPLSLRTLDGLPLVLLLLQAWGILTNF